MAQPWFEVRDLERSAGRLIALSASFELYGDMSGRMMTLASQYAPRQEIYKIDECFLAFAGVVAIGRDLRRTVLQWTDLPTSAGIGPTKTLVKPANYVAKTADRKPGSYQRSPKPVSTSGLVRDRLASWLSSSLYLSHQTSKFVADGAEGSQPFLLSVSTTRASLDVQRGAARQRCVHDGFARDEHAARHRVALRRLLAPSELSRSKQSHEALAVGHLRVSSDPQGA